MKIARVAACGSLLSMGFVVACTTDNVDEVALMGDAGLLDAGRSEGAPTFEAGNECETTCSSDGRKVLCKGEPIETCGADESCVEGKCLTACEAAEATHSYVGCDYYAVAPDVPLTPKSCFAAFVVNIGSDPVSLTVDLGATSFNAGDIAYHPVGAGESIQYEPLSEGILPGGESAILFLSVGTKDEAPDVPCPVGTKAGSDEDTAIHGLGFGEAFHIQASAPIAAYDMFPYGGAGSALSSATLLLPTSTWGTNYVGVDAYRLPGPPNDSNTAIPWLTIVAKEDETEVKLTPTADLPPPGPGYKRTLKGQLATFTLQKGEALQFEQKQELVGTPILSNKPIAVWGGHTLLFLPDGVFAGDGAHQQIPPVKALGHEYVAVKYRDRYEGVPETTLWRIVGAVDGTTLTYSPSAPSAAPTTLKSGQAVEIWTADPFSVRSQDDQHPFYMAGYMGGCTEYAGEDSTDCRGDPEFVNVVAPQQYLTDYTFFTDPTYPETNLVVVRVKGDGGFADVTLDCAGPLTGWQPLGQYEWTRIDLVRGNYEPQGHCDNGVHRMTSTQPFGLTVWGWGSAATAGQTTAVSYAYPAGMYIKPITDVVVTPVPK